nr:hypothetical protein [Tanacetum cinerariifolium]
VKFLGGSRLSLEFESKQEGYDLTRIESGSNLAGGDFLRTSEKINKTNNTDCKVTVIEDFLANNRSEKTEAVDSSTFPAQGIQREIFNLESILVDPCAKDDIQNWPGIILVHLLGKDEDALHILRGEIGYPSRCERYIRLKTNGGRTFVAELIVTGPDADIVSVLGTTKNILRHWVNCKVTRPGADIISVLRPKENILHRCVNCKVTRPGADIISILRPTEDVLSWLG